MNQTCPRQNSDSSHYEAWQFILTPNLNAPLERNDHERRLQANVQPQPTTETVAEAKNYTKEKTEDEAGDDVTHLHHSSKLGAISPTSTIVRKLHSP